MSAAEIIVAGLGLYAAIGAGVGLGFVIFGAPRVDPAAKGMPIRARLLIWPGAAALWPFILAIWTRRTAPPVS